MIGWLTFFKRSKVPSPGAGAAGMYQHEADDAVKEMNLPYQEMSPEEYVARHGHGWGCFSLDLHRYRDPEIEAWVRRLGELMHDVRAMERCRRLYLSADEYAQVQRELADAQLYGL